MKRNTGIRIRIPIRDPRDRITQMSGIISGRGVTRIARGEVPTRMIHGETIDIKIDLAHIGAMYRDDTETRVRGGAMVLEGKTTCGVATPETTPVFPDTTATT